MLSPCNIPSGASVRLTIILAASLLLPLFLPTEALSQSKSTFAETTKWIEGKLRKYANPSCRSCAHEFGIKFEQCSFTYWQSTFEHDYDYYRKYYWNQWVYKMNYASISGVRSVDEKGSTPDFLVIMSKRKDVKQYSRRGYCKPPNKKKCSSKALKNVKFITYDEGNTVGMKSDVATRMENPDERFTKAFLHLADLTRETCAKLAPPPEPF